MDDNHYKNILHLITTVEKSDLAWIKVQTIHKVVIVMFRSVYSKHSGKNNPTTSKGDKKFSHLQHLFPKATLLYSDCVFGCIIALEPMTISMRSAQPVINRFLMSLSQRKDYLNLRCKTL